MTARRPALFLVVVLLVTAGLVGCGDDGGDDDATSTTTTEASSEDEATTTEAPADDETTTTEAPADDETTTTEAPPEDATTTTPAPAENDASLEAYLLDPASVGDGFNADDTLGNGSIPTDLCPGTTLEETWDGQASQALIAGTGQDSVIFQQAVLRFADEAAAETFATTLADALVACQPGTTAEPLEGVGDQAITATVDEEETGSPAVAGIVRVGNLVGWHLGLAGPGGTPPLDETILQASAERLAG